MYVGKRANVRSRKLKTASWALEEGRKHAHLLSLILVHIGVDQRCRARDVESPAILPTMSKRKFQRGYGGTVSHRRFKMQAITHCDAKITRTRTTAGQFKGQFKGALDESSKGERTYP